LVMLERWSCGLLARLFTLRAAVGCGQIVVVWGIEGRG